MADIPDSDGLTPPQDRAVSALLTEISVRKAAEVAGVKERTLYSWLKTPAFAAAYRAARREATSQAIARLQQYSGVAANTLLRVMTLETTPAVARVTAARTVLEMAIRAVEIEDLATRLAALEERYAQKS
jgi:hypothetical protein